MNTMFPIQKQSSSVKNPYVYKYLKSLIDTICVVGEKDLVIISQILKSGMVILWGI